MKKIYMDNGATSFPKAPGVSKAMCNYIEDIGSNVGRGAYEDALEASRVILDTRERICRLFNFKSSNNVVFTKNITESLNIILKGLLGEGDHIIVSSLEHNAVMRPLTSLKEKGVSFSRAKSDGEGNLILSSVSELINENTKAIVMTHASNVCGTILDLESVGKIAKDNNLYFIIDAAQTAGLIEVDYEKLNADAIAFTGHKGLLGPQGTGGFIISDELADRISPLIEGGTGSVSDSEEQPNYMPDKFESGTPNIVGLYGLNASLRYIEEKTIENIRMLELNHVSRFIKALEDIKNIRIVGRKDLENRTAVVSLDFLGGDNAMLSWELEQSYHIATRVGMHCAPSAHKALNTYPQGTVRFSFSSFNTEEEIDYAVKAIKEIVSRIEEDI